MAWDRHSRTHLTGPTEGLGRLDVAITDEVEIDKRRGLRERHGG
jgi:hypothetical protein